MEINEEIAGLMAKVLHNEASQEEAARLADFLRQNPEAEQQFRRLRKIWPTQPEAGSAMHSQMDLQEPERLRRIREKARNERVMQAVAAPQPGLLKRILPVYKYAAAIIVVLFSSWLFFKSTTRPVANKTDSSKIVAAENGSRKRVMLPDGTTVLLNSGSSIKYCDDFEGKTRDVTLDGEAFFDVVKQPQRPFVVHAGKINIKVLGTAFNVKSYPDEDAVETTLIRGLVQINQTEKKDMQPIFLHPNQKVTLPRCLDCGDKDKTVVTEKPIQTEEIKVQSLGSGDHEKDWVETAWIHNRLEFKKTSFKEIGRQMERWYGVDIHINDQQLSEETFNGSFENETLEQALTALQKTTPFTFKIDNNEVSIDVQK